MWHDGRCTWMGATTDPKQRWRLKYRALGPRVYEGTAGIGLFLAQLAAVTGEAVARAAPRWERYATPSNARRRFPPADRDGLYAGVVGVALAAARVAAWLDEPELDARARALLADAALPDGPGRCPDVVMGSAGTVIGLLALAEACDDPTLVQRAVGRARASRPSHSHSSRLVMGQPRPPLATPSVRHLPRCGRHRLGAARAVRRDRGRAIPHRCGRSVRL